MVKPTFLLDPALTARNSLRLPGAPQDLSVCSTTSAAFSHLCCQPLCTHYRSLVCDNLFLCCFPIGHLRPLCTLHKAPLSLYLPPHVSPSPCYVNGSTPFKQVMNRFHGAHHRTSPVRTSPIKYPQHPLSALPARTFPPGHSHLDTHLGLSFTFPILLNVPLSLDLGYCTLSPSHRICFVSLVHAPTTHYLDGLISSEFPNSNSI